MRSLIASLAAALLLGIAAGGCQKTDSAQAAAGDDPAPAIDPAAADTAVFAGGCFWCMEPPYDRIDGVASTVSGFAGGEMVDPSYDQVASGATNHTEVVRVIYDASKVDYERLLRVYWHNVDPFDGTGQFCDRGSQYRPAIFTLSEEQRRLAEASKETVAARFDEAIAVEVEPLDAFYAANDYHQNFYQTHTRRYKSYRQACGRDARLREIWGDAAGGDAPLEPAR